MTLECQDLRGVLYIERDRVAPYWFWTIHSPDNLSSFASRYKLALSSKNLLFIDLIILNQHYISGVDCRRNWPCEGEPSCIVAAYLRTILSIICGVQLLELLAVFCSDNWLLSSIANDQMT